MNEFDLGWAVALFEGEGCIVAYRRPAGNQTRQTIQMKISMTDEDVIRQFHRIVECGKVTGPRRHKNDEWTPYYVWAAQSYADVRQLALRFRPYLGLRRQAQVDTALATFVPLNRRTQAAA